MLAATGSFALSSLASGPLGAALPTDAGPQVGANPVVTVLVLGLLALLPFLLMMTTSFLKFSVVLTILRSALGTQQVPPMPVIMGLSMVLTLYVMAPVGATMYTSLEKELTRTDRASVLSGEGAKSLLEAVASAKPPLRDFLQKHAHQEDVALFLRHSYQVAELRRAQGDEVEEPQQDSLLVLLPAFAISELAEAFAIGFLLFLPFLIIDMVVSNILLAMGMPMLPPVVVSLPFKLLLFIMIDGWRMLAQGLLVPYMA